MTGEDWGDVRCFGKVCEDGQILLWNKVTRKWEAVTQGFNDSRIVVQIDLRQERGQCLAESGSIGLEVGGEELAFRV